MEKQPVGQLPDLTQSNNDDEIMVITNSEHNQLKKEKISDFITDLTSTNENNALTKGTDGKLFVTNFGNASNITEGTLPTSVLPNIPKNKLPDIETADLPLSGVTADTYAYPSSVTVNAQGQVTAIEEGTPSGANANTDLSNLTETGESHFANPNLSNLTDEGEKHFLNKAQLTDCILEIQQRIKLEYENNVSGTLKAGSQVIIPSGFEDDGVTPKFVYKEIEQDMTFALTATSSTSRVGCAWYLSGSITSNVNRFSGDTAPTFTGYAVWYDTANNIIKYSDDSGATWSSGEYSLPFAETNINTEGMQITQVFNGFGYIGSTVWADKGIKFLCPNGRNEDGTLNNIERATEFLCLDLLLTVDRNYILSENYMYRRVPTATFIQDDMPSLPIADGSLAIWFNPSENIMYFANAGETTWTKSNAFAIVGNASLSHFNFKQPFRAVDYSDKAEITGWGAPSDKYDELSLGASGQEYPISREGYIWLTGNWTKSNSYVQVSIRRNGFTIYSLQTPELTTSGYWGLLARAKKGDSCKISYRTKPSPAYLRLIYAEGEN